jgi:hypothetical protein
LEKATPALVREVPSDKPYSANTLSNLFSYLPSSASPSEASSARKLLLALERESLRLLT